ncbi:MAG: hypothetical protein PHW27_02370 [Melioribacteraceae bacterium]|nr:hypothetical protein [Melioribacteraceae bacterium]MDD3557394.1 hypothetical protein [Melioribacteraceae bacterium]
MKTYHINIVLFLVFITFSGITYAQTYLTDESSGVLPENLSSLLMSSTYTTGTYALNKTLNQRFVNKNDVNFESTISDLELSVIVNQTNRFAKNTLAKVELNLPVQEESSKSNSIFSSEIFYFVTAAVLAGAGYLIWKENSSSEQTSSKTFGLPPKP